jgi:hypothetical protein
MLQRRPEVAGIFFNCATIVRLAGVLILGKTEEPAAAPTRRTTMETMAPLSDDQLASRGSLIKPARSQNCGDLHVQLHHALGHDFGADQNPYPHGQFPEGRD